MHISLIRIFSPPETQVFKLLSKICMVKKKKKFKADHQVALTKVPSVGELFGTFLVGEIAERRQSPKERECICSGRDPVSHSTCGNTFHGLGRLSLGTQFNKCNPF